MDKIKVSAIICNHCKDTIFSRATHDFRRCSCNKVAIDGGFEYTRIIGNAQDFTFTQVTINSTKQELYNDWSKEINKYGVIHASKISKRNDNTTTERKKTRRNRKKNNKFWLYFV